MPEYETRILNANGTTSLTATSYHASDFAAVRSGRKLCGSGETIEVWRGGVCVYAETPHEPALIWPVAGRALG